MTESKKFRQVGESLGEWTIPVGEGPQRRTLVAGAAWTIPVVVTAFGAPLAAASNLTPTLEFTLPSYSGSACGVITGVKVQLTTDGTTPAGAGQPITVNLADGYTFAGGGNSFSGFTAADGTVTLPDIAVPAQGGSSIFTATSGALGAVAPVTAPSGPAVANYGTNPSNPTEVSGVPAGSTAVGWGSFLSPSGDFYIGNQVISNTTSALVTKDDAAADFYTWISNGVGHYGTNPNSPTNVSGLPAGSTVVGWGVFLAPNGDLYSGSNVIKSNVISADVQHLGSTDFYTWMSNGVAYYGTDPANPNTVPGVPAGSTAVGWGSFLSPSGDFYTGNQVISNTTSALVTKDDASADFYTWISNGIGYYGTDPSNPTVVSGLPAGSTVVGWGTFLAPNGDLYSGGNVIKSNVTSADVQHLNPSSDFYTWLSASC